jgi:hypothetical protein
MTPEERKLRAKLGAHTSWANTTDPAARTAKARRAFEERFEKEADPDGVLPPEERARRAAHLRAAFFTRNQLKSAATRRKKAAERAAAKTADKPAA